MIIFMQYKPIMKTVFVLPLLLFTHICWCQPIESKLQEAIKTLNADSQFRHSILSLYVVEAKTGKVIYDKNSQLGLAPASCQKVITAVAAFSLLGTDYHYNTTVGYDGIIDSGILKGNIHIVGSGDPTLGSWRYQGTKEEVILTEFENAIRKAGINNITGLVLGVDKIWGTQVTPDGWIWQDIGNYYGAGATALNWRENQYDVILKSGKKLNDPVEIIGTTPKFLPGVHLILPGTGSRHWLYTRNDSG
jgi:D-alanyl-D-alanine carboxypeptidase/D-alanyl-D-alanine-endopeptidase (penicillin-binding protein 4)